MAVHTMERAQYLIKWRYLCLYLFNTSLAQVVMQMFQCVDSMNRVQDTPDLLCGEYAGIGLGMYRGLMVAVP